ncbi:uncharacterized protein LOC128735162 [Sabethes cyaneus]|uniref:uncharacterized protein LOC128735162 n=1 Tax=Sabethes cyaneus TaxID=53552 RepID=UPI00237D5B4E|nr:uncharacterized protein LOC128735162 [Sabethes cyaneus]
MPKGSRAKGHKPGVSCGICEDPDNSLMVSCDDCGRWFHFKCVGVDEGIEDVDWSCSSCETKRAAQGTSSRGASVQGGAGNMSTAEQQNQQLQQFQRMMDQMQARFDQQQHTYEELLRKKDLEMEKAISDLKRQYLLNLERKEQQIRDELSVPAIVLPNANSTSLGTESRVTDDVCSAITRMEKQLQDMAKKQEFETKRLDERLQAMEIGMSRSAPISDGLNLRANPSSGNQQSCEQSAISLHELSKSQLAARQAVAKELPTFSGNPEEWPLFIATYESSTRMCGFSDEENLLRLQRSLKGKALEAVRSRLLYPAGLDGVIKTLRTLFGRPEVIVNSLASKIREMSAPKTEKLGTLIDFGVAVQNMCATIVACGLNEHLCNFALLQELVDRLPPTIKLDWARHRQTLDTVTLSEFSSWLETLVEAACVVTVPSAFGNYASKSDRRSRKEEVYLHRESSSRSASGSPVSSKTTPRKKCVICDEECRNPCECKRFLAMDIRARWAAVKNYKLCRKCLAKHFGACTVREECGRNGCSYMHHKLLHDDSRYPRYSNPQPSTSQADAGASYESCNAHVSNVGKALFRYIPILIHGRRSSIRTYAFLDDGSSVTLMEHGLLSELGLSGESYPLCLGWTADHQRQEVGSVKLALEVSGIHDTKPYWIPKVHTVQSLALPRQTLEMDKLVSRYNHLRDLPCDSYHNVRPRLLIGIDNCHLGHALDSREGGKHEPIASRTRLGWTVFGPCSTSLLTAPNFTAHHSLHACPCCERHDIELHNTIKAYFSLDSLGIVRSAKPLLSKDDERAEQLLKSLTHTKGQRYETGLLWRFDNVQLPDSKSMALKRLECLEKRMQREPALGEALKEKLQDYLRSGYIEKLTERQLLEKFPRVWYLPIFPVINPNKPGKLRIVWDAAAKVAGTSLNSFLLTGPDQLAPLPSVLRRFREFRIAVTGDIREMFHQVMVNRNDQQCQRFLWRNGEQDRRPDVYVMKVMTFGATCSPSCAQYVKNHNAYRFQNQFPKAADAIMKDHYVDDMLCSEESEADAIKLAKDVRSIHIEAGFEIRNWLSNSKRVLRELEAEPGEKSLNLLSEMGTEKVLGLWWCTATDTFTFKVSPRINADLLQGRTIPTKRQILSTMMMIYDPLGLLANFLMFLKILLQEIWRSGIHWDDRIREEQWQKWQTWLRVFPQVENVSVPRCYRKDTSIFEQNTIQLHVFVDASENGFAAVVYMRFEENGVRTSSSSNWSTVGKRYHGIT